MGTDAVRAIEVEGHTSIVHARVELGSINVLVGANGAGKSNFIRALELLGQIADSQLTSYVARRGGESHLFNSGQRDRLRLALDFQQDHYEVVLAPSADNGVYFADESWYSDGVAVLGRRGGHRESLLDRTVRKSPVVSSAAQRIVEALRGCRVYHFHDTSQQSPIKSPSPTADNLALHGDGSNVAAVLAGLRDSDAPEDAAAFRRITGVVRQVAPFFREFVLKVERTDQIRLRWREIDSDTVFSAHQMSDGTLRFVCLATLLLQPSLPALVVLDEPELGLHPFGITQLAGLLRQASERSQVLLATQSVTLINEFELEDLIVVEREDGGSTFNRLDRQRLTAWLDDYSLGELWQKNLIGGRPGAGRRGIA